MRLFSHSIPDMSSGGQVLLMSEKAWNCAIDKNVCFKKITVGQLCWFAGFLRNEEDQDSYLTSPLYYAFTGRRGLWIYQRNNTFIPLCWHPNIADKILIFPSRGEKDPTVMNHLLEEIPQPSAGVRLVRIDRHLNSFTATKSFAQRFIHFATVTETVLDWKYPVRILSSENVATLQGSDFRHVRNHVKQIDRKSVSVERLAPHHHVLLENFIYAWAKNKSFNLNELNNLLSPYHRLLKLINDQEIKVDGLAAIINNKIEAFSLWDISNNETPTANRFVNICNVAHHGLADFMTKKMAETVCAQGIPYMNVGGSETAGLDQFKSKFMPVRSIDLCSVEVLLDDPMQQNDCKIYSFPKNPL